MEKIPDNVKHLNQENELNGGFHYLSIEKIDS